jgi:hypothetical protein
VSKSFESMTRNIGMRKTIERHPYIGQGIDGLTAQLNALLKSEKLTQRVILDVNKDFIHVEKLVKGTPDPDELFKRFDASIRGNQIHEYSPKDENLSSAEQFLDMFRQVSDEGLEISFIVCGNLVRLSSWIRIPLRNPKLFGVNVVQIGNIPDDVVLVCGSEWKEAEPEDITFSVKGTLP